VSITAPPPSDTCPPSGGHLDPGVPDRVNGRRAPAPADARRRDPGSHGGSHRADDGHTSARSHGSGTERHVYDHVATTNDHNDRV
jgi:hypothetical protein